MSEIDITSLRDDPFDNFHKEVRRRLLDEARADTSLQRTLLDELVRQREDFKARFLVHDDQTYAEKAKFDLEITKAIIDLSLRCLGWIR